MSAGARRVFPHRGNMSRGKEVVSQTLSVGEAAPRRDRHGARAAVAAAGRTARPGEEHPFSHGFQVMNYN